MKISVVIPVYNVEAYLEACVRSVQAQTWRDLEMVLVDDGSTDSSGALCDALAAQDARIRVLHQANQGLAMARNNGLAAAAGDYVAFLDSDDYWQRPQALEQMQALLNVPQPPDVVLFGYCKKNLKTGEISTVPLDPLPAASTIEQKWALLQKRQYCNSAWSKLCRRTFLTENSLFFPAGRKSEDLVWSRQILTEAEDMAVYPHALLVYQTGRAGSISNSFQNHHYQDILEQIVQDTHALQAAPEVARRLGRAYWAEQVCWILGYLPMVDKPLRQVIAECEPLFALLPAGVCRRARLVRLLCRVLGRTLTVRLLYAYLNR